MSQDDFARVLWVTYSTLSRWERGHAVPFGLHLHILEQLKTQLARSAFKNTLKDPRMRMDDPLFLLYRLLKPLYAGGPKPPSTSGRVSNFKRPKAARSIS
jgi:transcriptional regulator with XRE-family HTH domain